MLERSLMLVFHVGVRFWADTHFRLGEPGRRRRAARPAPPRRSAAHSPPRRQRHTPPANSPAHAIAAHEDQKSESPSQPCAEPERLGWQVAQRGKKRKTRLGLRSLHSRTQDEVWLTLSRLTWSMHVGTPRGNLPDTAASPKRTSNRSTWPPRVRRLKRSRE